jgi:hypothetical protein
LKEGRNRTKKNKNIDLSNKEPFNGPLTEEELDEALSECKGSSPGPDDIHYEFLKKIYRKTRLNLLGMYEDIWSKGNFPKEWRSATVIPILKPGKNPSITESYRPISPTSCLWKFLERIVNKRLVYILEESNLLPSQQYGFRKNRSITDVLTIRENNIAEAIKKNN